MTAFIAWPILTIDSNHLTPRHEVLGIGNVKTLFGTAPGFWNVLLGAMAQLPSSLLSNEPIMEKLALFSLPIVRIVDFFAGATNAMRVDVSSNKDPSVQEMALYGKCRKDSILLHRHKTMRFNCT